MNQYSTTLKSQLLTLQPGDATKYSFIISLNEPHEITEIIACESSEELGQAVNFRYSDTEYNNMSFCHGLGWSNAFKIWFISILEPTTSAVSFSIGENLLNTFNNKNVNARDYLSSHFPKVNVYTLCVALGVLKAFASANPNCNTPDDDCIQLCIYEALLARTRANL